MPMSDYSRPGSYLVPGGGGTFGVVLEATILASPPVTLQTVIVSWPAPNRTLTDELWSIMADNALQWAAEGWGGFSMSEIAILVNPVLDAKRAASSMKPLIDFGERLQRDGVSGAQTVITTFPSFLAFFNAFTSEHVAVSHYLTGPHPIPRVTRASSVECRNKSRHCLSAGRQRELPNSRKSNEVGRGSPGD